MVLYLLLEMYRKRICVTLLKIQYKKFRKVRIVHNHLNVSPPRASIARFSDVILKRKVKLRYLLEKNVPQKRVEVVVYDGVIFLMGFRHKK